MINFIFNTRYADEFRLKLIRMTGDEIAKSKRQAISQTDNIVVFKIQHVPGMNIDYDLTIIDTPGFGDTQGVDYEKLMQRFGDTQGVDYKKLMQNIEDLFKSKKITRIDVIGFVAKAGDARLTA